MPKKNKYNESFMKYNDENNSNNSEDSKDSNKGKEGNLGIRPARRTRLKKAGIDDIYRKNDNFISNNTKKNNFISNDNDNNYNNYNNDNNDTLNINNKFNKKNKSELPPISNNKNNAKKNVSTTENKEVSQIAKEEDIFHKDQLPLVNDIQNFLKEYHKDNAKDNAKDMERYINGINLTYALIYNLAKNKDIANQAKKFNYRITNFKSSESDEPVAAMKIFFSKGKDTYEAIYCRENNNQLIIKTDYLYKYGKYSKDKEINWKYWDKLPNHSNLVREDGKILLNLFPQESAGKADNAKVNKNNDKEYDLPKNAEKLLDSNKIMDLLLPEELKEKFKEIQEFINKIKTNLSTAEEKESLELVNEAEKYFNKNKDNVFEDTNKKYKNKKCDYLQKLIDHTKAMIMLKNIKGDDPEKNKEETKTVSKIEEEFNRRQESGWYKGNEEKEKEILDAIRDAKVRLNKEQRGLEERKYQFISEILNAKTFKQLQNIWSRVKQDTKLNDQKNIESLKQIKKRFRQKAEDQIREAKDFTELSKTNVYYISLDIAVKEYISHPNDKTKKNMSNIIGALVSNMHWIRLNGQQTQDGDFYKIMYNCRNVMHKYIDQLKEYLKKDKNNKELREKIDILEQYDTILTVCQYCFKAQTDITGGQAYKTTDSKNIYQDARIELLLALFKLQNNVVTEETVKSIWFYNVVDNTYAERFINRFIIHQALYDRKSLDKKDKHSYRHFEQKMLRSFAHNKKDIQKEYEDRKENRIIKFLNLPISYIEQREETIGTMLEKGVTDEATLSETLKKIKNEDSLNKVIIQAHPHLEKIYCNLMLQLINDYTPEIIEIYDKQTNNEKTNDKNENLLLTLKKNKLRSLQNKNSVQSKNIKYEIENLSKDTKQLEKMIEFACQFAETLLEKNDKVSDQWKNSYKNLIPTYDKLICTILYSANIFISNKIAKLKSTISKSEQSQYDDELETSKEQLQAYESISEKMQEKLKKLFTTIKESKKSAGLLCSNIPFLIKDITDEELQSENIKSKINALKDTNQINSDKVTYSRNVLPVIHQLNIGHDGKNRNGNADKNKRNNAFINTAKNTLINNEDDKRKALRLEVNKFIKDSDDIQKYLEENKDADINKLKENIAFLYQIYKYGFQRGNLTGMLQDNIKYQNGNLVWQCLSSQGYVLQGKTLPLDGDGIIERCKRHNEAFITRIKNRTKADPIEDLYTAQLEDEKKDVKRGGANIGLGNNNKLPFIS